MRKLLFTALFLASFSAGAVTLKWAAQNDILTLDPHSQNHATTHSILQHTYEGLTRYTKTFGVEPCLAVSWKQLSDTHWRFNLRKGVKFHDGSPLTGEVVAFTFDRSINKENPLFKEAQDAGGFPFIDDYIGNVVTKVEAASRALAAVWRKSSKSRQRNRNSSASAL